MADYLSIPLLALIAEQNLLDEFQIEEAAGEVETNGVTAFQALVDLGYLDADQIIQAMCDHLGAESMDLKDAMITPELTKLLPSGLARQYKCVPVSHFDPTLQVAFADPLDPAAIDEIGFTTGLDVQVVVADPAQVVAAVKEHYGEDEADAAADGAAFDEILKEMGVDSSDDGKIEVEDIEQIDVSGDERDIAAFVDAVLVAAIGDRASDIHFEPFENEFKIRYRVDGALYELAPPPKHLAGPVTTRVKFLDDALEVTVEQNVLTIKGEKRVEKPAEAAAEVAAAPVEAKAKTGKKKKAKVRKASTSDGTLEQAFAAISALGAIGLAVFLAKLGGLLG